MNLKVKGRDPLKCHTFNLLKEHVEQIQKILQMRIQPIQYAELGIAISKD